MGLFGFIFLKWADNKELSKHLILDFKHDKGPVCLTLDDYVSLTLFSFSLAYVMDCFQLRVHKQKKKKFYMLWLLK